MQMIDPFFAELEAVAEDRGISVQELIRAIIVPEWLRMLRARALEKAERDSETVFSPIPGSD